MQIGKKNRLGIDHYLRYIVIHFRKKLISLNLLLLLKQNEDLDLVYILKHVTVGVIKDFGYFMN